MPEEWIERRITYSYGVNRDRTCTGRASYEWLEENARQETLGNVNVTKRERRTVMYSDWEAENE